VFIADLYLGRNSPYTTSSLKRLAMATKGGATATWIRAFDLLALLIRSCLMFDHATKPPPVTTVVLGPVPAQRHGNSHLAQFFAGTRPWPPPLRVDLSGRNSDVPACLEALEEQQSRSRTLHNTVVCPVVPSPALLPATADALPFPSSEDAAMLRRLSEDRDKRQHNYLTASAAVVRQGFFQIDGNPKKFLKNDVQAMRPLLCGAQLTVENNMIQARGRSLRSDCWKQKQLARVRVCVACRPLNSPCPLPLQDFLTPSVMGSLVDPALPQGCAPIDLGFKDAPVSDSIFLHKEMLVVRAAHLIWVLRS
jgi:hypothetical protein